VLVAVTERIETMFKANSPDERSARADERVERKAPKALANVKARRSMLVTHIASPKLSAAASKEIDEHARAVFCVDRAIASLERDPGDDGS
jgi:hypothetical protein